MRLAFLCYKFVCCMAAGFAQRDRFLASLLQVLSDENRRREYDRQIAPPTDRGSTLCGTQSDCKFARQRSSLFECPNVVDA